MRKTKIVATIGPASDSEECLDGLIDAGVDVVRFNMKHSSVEWHSERMERLEKLCVKKDRRVAILLDLQGPEVRIDEVPERWSEVSEGDVVKMVVPEKEGITLDHPEVFSYLKKDQKVYVDDGLLELKVTNVSEDWAELMVVDGGNIKPRKTVNFPGAKFDFEALVDQDLKHLSLASRHHVDFVALSFVRKAADILLLKEELRKYKLKCKVIAKIEHPDAVENFEEILSEADGIMVARGDLGIEYPLEEVPALQKMIIKRCRLEGKPVIVATQMLESMIYQPRPTRAEVSDVANAVYDGADALMLSGETASGKYCLRSVQTMVSIAERTEDLIELPEVEIDWEKDSQTVAVVASAYKLMECVDKSFDNLAAFVVATETGRTVEFLSRMRPRLPILALTRDEKVVDQLKMNWGVRSFLYKLEKNKQVNIEEILNYLKKNGVLKAGERAIMIYGEGRELDVKSVIRLLDL